jgi:hypothetical protein
VKRSVGRGCGRWAGVAGAVVVAPCAPGLVVLATLSAAALSLREANRSHCHHCGHNKAGEYCPLRGIQGIVVNNLAFMRSLLCRSFRTDIRRASYDTRLRPRKERGCHRLVLNLFQDRRSILKEEGCPSITPNKSAGRSEEFLSQNPQRAGSGSFSGMRAHYRAIHASINSLEGAMFEVPTIEESGLRLVEAWKTSSISFPTRVALRSSTVKNHYLASPMIVAS